jgi:hypothetical protein
VHFLERKSLGGPGGVFHPPAPKGLVKNLTGLFLLHNMCLG